MGDRIDAPDHPHQLTADDRVAPIGADTKIEGDIHVPRRLDVLQLHNPPVEVYRGDLVLEKRADARHGEGFFQQILVEESAADGVDTLYCHVRQATEGAASGNGVNIRV